jgi:Zinc-binding dehydrogenase
VSMLALQFAKAAGARVIATSSSDAKLRRAAELGAAELINYRKHPDWEAEVLRLTGGRGVDHVIEVGGAGTVPRSIAACRVGGQVHLIGVLTAGAPFEPTALIRRSVALRGLYVGSRQMFEAMNRHIAQNGIRPAIDRVFGFDEAKAAYRHDRVDERLRVGHLAMRIEGGFVAPMRVDEEQARIPDRVEQAGAEASGLLARMRQHRLDDAPHIVLASGAGVETGEDEDFRPLAFHGFVLTS